MVDRFVEHLAPGDRARLNRFLSHKGEVLEDVLCRAVDDQLRWAALWERSQELSQIVLTYVEVRAAALTYSEISVLTLAKHQLKGRKIGWSVAESCLLRMEREGAVIRSTENNDRGLSFKLHGMRRLSLVADDDV